MTSKRPDINDINNLYGLYGVGPLPSAAPVGAFNADAVESLIETKGISAMHYRHAPNPDMESVNGVVNPNNNAADRAFRYWSVRPLQLVPQNFSLENRLTAQAIWGTQSALLNVAGHYSDDNSIVYVRPNDIIVLGKDPSGAAITVGTDQRLEYDPTGPMKLQFRIESIDYVGGRDGKCPFVPDQDYCIQNGKLVWLPGGRKPSFKDGKGEVLSIVYYTKPVFIVKSVPHSLRILPSNAIGSGNLPRVAIYGPQLIVANQSWIRQDDQALLDFGDLPDFPEYPTGGNTTGGTF